MKPNSLLVPRSQNTILCRSRPALLVSIAVWNLSNKPTVHTGHHLCCSILAATGQGEVTSNVTETLPSEQLDTAAYTVGCGVPANEVLPNTQMNHPTGQSTESFVFTFRSAHTLI